MSEQSPMPAPPWPGLHSTPPGDLFEDDDDLIELEFKVFTFELSALGDVKDEIERDNMICEWLNNGWRIHDHVVCPPKVMLIFHKEKESSE